MTVIDPQIEEPARDMLGHCIGGKWEELAALIESVGGQRYREVLGLCLIAAAYIAVDVSGRWPTDADVREIARVTAGYETEAPLTREDVYDYLSGAALGFRPLPEALGSAEAAATLPVFVTASMVLIFRPEDRKWWEYLDQIWGAYEAAERTDLAVLPALQLRSGTLEAAKARSRKAPGDLPARSGAE